MRILITGTAGFIGFHLARRLLTEGHHVTGIDGVTPYYDVTLKEARHRVLAEHDGFVPRLHLLEDMDALSASVAVAEAEIVIHLAAQAGVRYSLENPRAYLQANLEGTFNLLEALRVAKPAHVLMASTSSVYGGNASMPFRETDRTDHPLTLYAATKKGTEDMAHSSAHVWRLPVTMLRFFTVYGPWGRPDMALFKFVRNTLAGQPIDVYNHGRMKRDFTYVDDVVESIVRLIPCVPRQGSPVGGSDSVSPVAPYRVVNVGGGRVVELLDYIDAIDRSLGMIAKRNMLGMQTGDVPATFASPDLLFDLTGYRPTTTIADGVAAFVAWYLDYYGPFESSETPIG